MAGALLLALAATALALILGGRAEPVRHVVVLPDAGTLAVGDEVRVADLAVGAVRALRLGPAGAERARVEIEVRPPDEVGALRRGTTAAVRGGGGRTTLTLRPGPDDAPPLAAGEAIGGGATDRGGSRVAGSAGGPANGDAGRRGRRSDRASPERRRATAALRRALARADGPDAVLAALADDTRRLRRVIAGTARIADAVDGERASLRRTLTRGERIVATLRDGGEEIDGTLRRAPAVARRATSALAGLRGLLDDLRPVAEALGDATGPLGTAQRGLRAALRDAGPAIEALRHLVRDPGKGDDLLDLLARGPRAARTLVPALDSATRSLAGLRPIAAFLRPYGPDLVGALANATAATAGYDANGHLARVQPLLAPDPAGADPLLRGAVGALRRERDDEADPRSAVRRCPGAATQPRPDGSNPYRGDDGRLDCNPEPAVPGP
ncbi:MAG: MlaD family protein [Solirubrobacteraceae bacterium]